MKYCSTSTHLSFTRCGHFFLFKSLFLRLIRTYSRKGELERVCFVCAALRITVLKMSSFTPEQVGHFRQVFSQFSNEDLGGVEEINFIAAITASMDHCHFTGGPPSQQYLEREFRRLTSENDNAVILWQQFFQVYRHEAVSDIFTLFLCPGADPSKPTSVCISSTCI